MNESFGEMFCDCDFRVLDNISIIHLNQLHEFIFAIYLMTPSVTDIITAAITTGCRLLEIRVTKPVKEIPALQIASYENPHYVDSFKYLLLSHHEVQIDTSTHRSETTARFLVKYLAISCNIPLST
jgi:hypothetical protein